MAIREALTTADLNKDTPGLFADGGGLYLQITEAKLKTWVFRFMLNGRRRDMGLGRFGPRDVTLKAARDKAAEVRKLVKSGIDPIELVRAEKKAKEVEAAKKMPTFKECAEAYIKGHEAGWRNAKHAAQWTSTLDTYVYPTLGHLPVDTVDTALVLKVLEPIWTQIPETAGRVRGRIEVIWDWARVRHGLTGENPARWKGHLSQTLPQKGKVRKVQSHAALPYDEMGSFMASLRKQEGFGAKGLEFQILTASRTSEVLGAKWHEIDLEKKLWTIPADRMKAGKEHRVPMSEAALSLLESMKRVRISEFVFPGARAKAPLSNMTFLMTLRRMKRGDLTAHGFRSTFKDWCAEQTSYPNEVSEMALAHAVGDKVEAAYRRGDLFEKRARLMNDWANFCNTPCIAGGKAVAIEV